MDADFVVPGFDAAGIAAGIKKSGAPDLALIASRVPCRAAAAFTKNAFPAAPVEYDRRLLSLNAEAIHGVVINAGCANACTGTPGDANARLTAELVERALGANDHSILVMSTGVIGVQLPMDKLESGIPRAVEQLRPAGWADAATAIMTTDTRPKLHCRNRRVYGQPGRNCQGRGHDPSQHGNDAERHCNRRGHQPTLAATSPQCSR
jgi:glutamate N-acetyltransferase/amino-acid N-acetyltransferase